MELSSAASPSCYLYCLDIQPKKQKPKNITNNVQAIQICSKSNCDTLNYLKMCTHVAKCEQTQIYYRQLIKARRLKCKRQESKKYKQTGYKNNHGANYYRQIVMIYSIQLLKKKAPMENIRVMYNTTNRVIESSDVGQFSPIRAYVDPFKIKLEKERAAKGYAKDPANKKINLTTKKGTFLDVIEKEGPRSPSPTSYQPREVAPQYKNKQTINLINRHTIFDELSKQSLKNMTPCPQAYSLENKKKSVSLGKFEMAQNANYLEGTMSMGCLLPGVGQYRLKDGHSLSKLGKWDKAPRSISQDKQNKESGPGCHSYNPQDPAKKLFSQMGSSRLKTTTFDKQARFSNLQKRSNPNFMYSGVSEWGLRADKKRKDMLTQLSNHSIYSRSVYYN